MKEGMLKLAALRPALYVDVQTTSHLFAVLQIEARTRRESDTYLLSVSFRQASIFLQSYI